MSYNTVDSRQILDATNDHNHFFTSLNRGSNNIQLIHNRKSNEITSREPWKLSSSKQIFMVINYHTITDVTNFYRTSPLRHPIISVSASHQNLLPNSLPFNMLYYLSLLFKNLLIFFSTANQRPSPVVFISLNIIYK